MSKKIAVVEDDHALQRVLVEWLKGEGYEVVGITTGREALDVIPREHPDLILLDIILPEVNGFEVMEQLGKDQSTANIPIVILSNLGDEEHQRHAMELGAKGYLVKAEFDLTSTKKMIEQVFSDA